MELDKARKVLRSRGGLKIMLEDENGKEQFVVETSGGQRFVLQNGPGKIEVADGNGNSLELTASGITVKAVAKVIINAGIVEVNSGMVNVNAPMTKFSGVVHCDTLISNSVVSASYTPGAGNVL
jgi:hypothetical protein